METAERKKNRLHTTLDAHAQCPFYGSTWTYDISCEGCQQGTTMRLRFDDDRARLTFEQEYCFNLGNCEKCPYYAAHCIDTDPGSH